MLCELKIMKMNIKLTKIGTGFLEDDCEIVNIDITNGHWKYNDDHMETDAKEPLTINSINKAHYLHLPVKDAYPFCDHDLLREKNEYKVVDAMVRTYDTLLSYLNCRIENTKEDYWEHGWTEREFTIVLFDLASEKFREDVTKDVVYEKEALCEVEITVVE